jgi:EAL domain-containing protein (putative c-di-GMP-specific phosphodiesterase class I)/ActR/RegA family two-component response regulator
MNANGGQGRTDVVARPRQVLLVVLAIQSIIAALAFVLVWREAAVDEAVERAELLAGLVLLSVPVMALVFFIRMRSFQHGATALRTARTELEVHAARERLSSGHRDALTEQRRRMVEALAAREFRLVYQPKVSLSTGTVTGVEALLRWDSPEGPVSPVDFIPVAEESGFIVELGAWVLEQALGQMAAWRREMPGLMVPVCVNVSAVQFNDELCATVKGALDRTGLPPQALGIEITETVAMADPDDTARILRELKVLGVELLIDDFGTGYSSLAYLQGYPIDIVKIDRSFVSGLGVHPGDGVIAAAVIGIAGAMGFDVVAEGIETQAQLDALRLMGCDRGQGFLLCRPGSPTEIGDFMRARTASAAMDHASFGADRVVVADDAADIRTLVRISLAAAGFEVREAARGDDALALIRDMRPDCAVLDLDMPGLDGIDVCRAVRSDRALDRCALILLTAEDGSFDKAAAFRAGADDYLLKPVDCRTLPNRIAAEVARKRRAPRTKDRVR